MTAHKFIFGVKLFFIKHQIVLTIFKPLKWLRDVDLIF